jgi:hypothetical protein
MAGLDLVAIQDTIADYIKDEFAAYQVYEDYVLNDEELQKVDAKIKPYIVISWDGLSRSNTGGSFSGVRFDEYYSGFSIGVIAPSPRQCRRAMNLIFDNLTGWSYDGVGRLSPSANFGTFVVAERNGVPHLYMSMADFEFPVNAVDPGAYIEPPAP